jgi:hypothetical protein
MESCCDGVFKDHHVELYNIDKIPSYRHWNFYALDDLSDDDGFSIHHERLSGYSTDDVVLVMAVVLLSIGALMISRNKQRMHQANEAAVLGTEVMNVQYQSIN